MNINIRLHRRTLIAIVGAIAAVSVLFFVATGLVPGHTRALLRGYGFPDAIVKNTAFHGNSFAHRDIQLDDGGFSTIRALRIQPDWSGIFGGRFIGNLIVDDMRLTGEWFDGTFAVAGWAPRLPPFPQQKSIIVNGMRLDLDTVFGAIRMETKGRLTRDEKGDYKVEAALYGRQHQLAIDNSTWVGTVSSDGSYVLEGEIPAANLRTDQVEANRVSGWLQVTGAAPADGVVAIPLLSGQLVMGRFAFMGVPMGNASITIDGPASGPALIIAAEVPGLSGMRVNADLKPQDGEWHLKAAINTTKLTDMLAFMFLLRDKLEEHKSNALVSFLITPGNTERLRKQVEAIKYDELELHIEGPLSSLQGNLIVRSQTAAGIKRHAISLDPGVRR